MGRTKSGKEHEEPSVAKTEMQVAKKTWDMSLRERQKLMPDCQGLTEGSRTHALRRKERERRCNGSRRQGRMNVAGSFLFFSWERP